MATECPKCQFDNTADSKFCKECGTQLIPSNDPGISKTMTLETPAEVLTRGTLFAGRYEVIEKLGSGGMGSVYRAYDKKIEEEVALKLIRPDLAAERKTIDRFRNEIKIARKIRHASVCAMHDLHLEGNTYFFTMEYVPGEDLKSLVRRTKALTVGTAISIARQVAEGLGEAHKLGIVHRDLKPGNIMIDKEGKAKVMDFGIARIQAASGTTAEGVMIGTPEYMSPEQVEGKTADARSDLYALGVILFEMVTGQAPFEGDTPLSIAHKHRYEPPLDPQQLNAHVPIELNRIILRLMEKDREKRYQSTEELIADLKAAEDGLPSAERVPADLPSTRRELAPSRKNTVEFTPRKLFIPALVIVVVMAAALFFLLRKGTKDYSYHVVVTEFLNQTGDPNFDSVGRFAAERVSQGLEELGLFGVAPLAKYDLGSDKNLEETDFLKIAKNSDAAIIVTGELYVQGVNLFISSKLYDAVKQELFPSPGTLSAPVDEMSELLDSLSDMLKSAVYGTHDPMVAMWQKISPYIPRYEALLEFMNGTEMFWNLQYQPAAAHFDQAVEIDADYFLAHAFALMSYGMSLNHPAVERYFEKIGRFSDLSPGEKYLVDLFSAIKDGGHERIYSIAKKLDALAPGTTISEWFASAAIAANRPQVAIKALERLGPDSVYTACNYCYWDYLTFAYHMIGDYKQELKEALKAEKQFSESWMPLWFKVRALSALGRLDEVKKIVEENCAKPTAIVITAEMNPAVLMNAAGMELKAHDHNDKASEMYEQALSWLSQRSLTEELSDAMKLQLAWVQFDTEHGEEAVAAFRDLNESSPENVEYLGALGVALAKRGDREESLRISQRLKNWDKPFSHGAHIYWQAAIFANLGEKGRAVSLLQTALRQGFNYRLFYCKTSLEPLWDYRPFVELIKPRD